MEPPGGASPCPGPEASVGVSDAEPSSTSRELPSTDPGKLPALPVGPRARPGSPASGPPSSQAPAGDTDPKGQLSGGRKVPNRDSGIDSPSCSVAGEPFPGQEGGPPGEGSGEEPAPEASGPRAHTPDEAELAKCSEPRQLLHIAQELLSTEETYVKRLHLLDQVFCTRLAAAGISPEVTTGIFSNISSIYRFHGQFLLPELQLRILQEWDTKPRLGDILQKLAPFLKMYGEYVKNFDRAVELVSTWTQRSPLFKDVVQGIQKQEVCGSLTLQHHMLEPVQRVPRYELLLKDYLKRLPADAPDRKDAERSLELISTAANHSNAAIRKMEKMHKLLEVYERLGGEEDIVNPANELIKEGPIQKLSAKNGTTQDRHLFLFNSMILYCVPKLRLMGQKFSVREKMDISDLQVQDVAKRSAAHTFVITGKKRSLELQSRTEEEKKDWIQVIEATIEKHKQNSQSFKAFGSSLGLDENPSVPADPLTLGANPEEPAVVADGGGGAVGPELRRGSSKTRRDRERQGCRICGDSFNSITRRRHHCKPCGAVICGKCSEFKTEHGRQSRFCRDCFLTQPVAPASPSPEEPTGPKPGVEELSPADPQPSLLCGALRVSEDCVAWTEVWASIPAAEPPELLLCLKGSGRADWLPLAIALPGCQVSPVGSVERLDAGHAWTLQQAQRVWYLSVPSEELRQRWLEALSTAAHGDPAPPHPGDPAQAPAAP
ncbi:LOW QUALITY PROTEIN: FYVE, RhoGEF and PH domain-containing protein 3 [Sorex araneus]|uniref:LOW QUALITY PROTEIN: FYVE, RhoGEF and PH domain-containing protein 3 n=1 Tax=Sorex araneus TaxID=42254 RepID=UPI0024336B67|nr:LOW QUALITY PROTEIN: FYVE, RhoGEF and PH domain-containing protein 3 [Sorex araneus]